MTTMNEAIQKMQTKRAGIKRIIWQNANGTYSHHKDGKREWEDLIGCQTDLKFSEEWK
jgi:hypothetical protein